MLTVDDKVLSDIARGFKVPAQPKLLLELQSIVEEEEPNLDLIAETISKDVGISATVLKTVNSPLYGLARTVADIPLAVKYIGINGIVALVTSNLLRESFNQQQCSIPLEEFWETANNIAQTMVFIAKHLGKRISSEKLFAIGLFHDCGIPVMAMKYQNYGKVLKLAEETPSKTLADIEEHAYKLNHATIGYYVASSWRLPVEICQIILRHNESTFLEKLDGSESQQCFAILKMAEQIVHQHKYFRAAPDWENFADSVLTVLNCDEEALQDIFEDVVEQLSQ